MSKGIDFRKAADTIVRSGALALALDSTFTHAELLARHDLMNFPGHQAVGLVHAAFVVGGAFVSVGLGRNIYNHIRRNCVPS